MSGQTKQSLPRICLPGAASKTAKTAAGEQHSGSAAQRPRNWDPLVCGSSRRSQRLASRVSRSAGIRVQRLSSLRPAAFCSIRYQLSGGTTIGELADLFVEEGAAEHVRGDLAFAQSILETGSFGHATDNNYGGIGACDSCKGEIAFPTPRDGVRGQIQLLKNYADPSSRASTLANPPSPPIYGRTPRRRRAARTTRSSPRAAFPPGTSWATATGRPTPTYAPKVLGLYFEMVDLRRPHS